MTEPIPLYRYLDSDAALKTIATRAFRVGRTGNFNDPFEWRLGMAGIDQNLAKQIIEGFVSDVNSDMQEFCVLATRFRSCPLVDLCGETSRCCV